MTNAGEECLFGYHLIIVDLGKKRPLGDVSHAVAAPGRSICLGWGNSDQFHQKWYAPIQ